MRHDSVIPPNVYIEHTKRELRLLGYNVDEPAEDDPKEVNREMLTNITALVEAFANQLHSQASGAYLLNAVALLCSLKPLLPLTGAPEEWTEAANGVQQNVRCAAILKNANNEAVHVGGVVYVDPVSGEHWQDDSCTVPISFPYDPRLSYVEKAIPRKSALEAGATHRPIILPEGVH